MCTWKPFFWSRYYPIFVWFMISKSPDYLPPGIWPNSHLVRKLPGLWLVTYQFHGLRLVNWIQYRFFIGFSNSEESHSTGISTLRIRKIFWLKVMVCKWTLCTACSLQYNTLFDSMTIKKLLFIFIWSFEILFFL